MRYHDEQNCKKLENSRHKSEWNSAFWGKRKTKRPQGVYQDILQNVLDHKRSGTNQNMEFGTSVDEMAAVSPSSPLYRNRSNTDIRGFSGQRSDQSCEFDCAVLYENSSFKFVLRTFRSGYEAGMPSFSKIAIDLTRYGHFSMQK